MNFEKQTREYREFIELYLKNLYTEFQSEPQKLLFEAMEYSLLAGGKRLRPIFALAECVVGTGKTRLPSRQPLK